MLNLAQNVAQFCAQNSKCLLNCTPAGAGRAAAVRGARGRRLLRGPRGHRHGAHTLHARSQEGQAKNRQVRRCSKLRFWVSSKISEPVSYMHNPKCCRETTKVRSFVQNPKKTDLTNRLKGRFTKEVCSEGVEKSPIFANERY